MSSALYRTDKRTVYRRIRNGQLQGVVKPGAKGGKGHNIYVVDPGWKNAILAHNIKQGKDFAVITLHPPRLPRRPNPRRHPSGRALHGPGRPLGVGQGRNAWRSSSAILDCRHSARDGNQGNATISKETTHAEGYRQRSFEMGQKPARNSATYFSPVVASSTSSALLDRGGIGFQNFSRPIFAVFT